MSVLAYSEASAGDTPPPPSTRPPGWCIRAKCFNLISKLFFYFFFFFLIIFPSRFLASEQMCCVSSRRFHLTRLLRGSPRSSADVRCSMSCTVRAPVDRLSTAEYFSAFKARPDIFGLCLCDKRKIIKINDLKKSFLTQHKQIMPQRMWMSRITNVCVRECVCEWVHIWACFCLWAVIENGQGLFLSALIRGSCFSHLLSLHPGLIFHLFFLLFPYCSSFFVVAVGLGQGSAFASVSCPSSFLLYFISYFSDAQWLAVDRLLTGRSMNTHTPGRDSHQTCCPFSLVFPKFSGIYWWSC